MPTSPEGIAAILDQLSRIANDLGRYATALESNTQAVSRLEEELKELKDQLTKDAIIRAKEEGRLEAEREAKRKRNSRDDDSGTFAKPSEGLVSVKMTMNQVFSLIGAIGGAGAFIKSFWKDIVDALSGTK